MKYSIIKADIRKDKEEILALWKRNALPLSEARYSWIYENNPAGSAICYLAVENKTDSVIGATALFPRRIRINRECYRAGVGGDFVVDKDHRGFGPAFGLQKATTSDCDSEKFKILYGFPNKQSQSILSRGGWKTLGDATRLIKLLKSYWLVKQRLNLPIVTKLASGSIDLILKCFSKETYQSRSGQYLFQNLSSFDTRFDDLWEKASGQFQIIGERTSSYLNWRFKHYPGRRYLVFTLLKKQGDEVLGYIIYYVEGNGSRIDDILFLDEGEIIDSLISEFLLLQRKEGIDSISFNCLGTQHLVKKFTEYGFLVRSKELRVMIYVSSNSSFLPDLLDPGKWHLSSGDQDI